MPLPSLPLPYRANCSQDISNSLKNKGNPANWGCSCGMMTGGMAYSHLFVIELVNRVEQLVVGSLHPAENDKPKY